MSPAYALDVIPGLKGFGTDTRAGYGAINPPEICIVDDLTTSTGNPDWDAANYTVGLFKGSLRQCIEGLDTLLGETIGAHTVLANSGKIIFFESNGTIAQTGTDEANSTFIYDVGSYTSIIGQTSPFPGILLRNISLKLEDVNNITIQHIRTRLQGIPTLSDTLHEPITLSGAFSNIVIDHISASWGRDAQVDMYNNGDGAAGSVTLSNSILGEGIRRVHDLEDDISQGGQMGAFKETSGTAEPVLNVFLYNNYILQNNKRHPGMFGGTALYVNNYVFNAQLYGMQMIPRQRTGSENITLSLVGNVVEGGNMSLTGAKHLLSITGNKAVALSYISMYAFDNRVDSVSHDADQVNSSDWGLFDIRAGLAGDLIVADGPNYPNIKITGETPSDDSPLWPTGFSGNITNELVAASIVSDAGAYPASRDSVDNRFINYIGTGAGRSSILIAANLIEDDWPALDEDPGYCGASCPELNIPANPHVDAGDGYTNLEVWAHAQARFAEGIGSGVGVLGSGLDATIGPGLIWTIN
ncbi:hypothetical protein KAR91_33740 [Candidatus Pacearchaeota archaeon]|nr:hypothetical protein [Candidatus Pacearchaeota archaeon]